MSEWKEDRLDQLTWVITSNVDKKIDLKEKSINLCNYMDVYTSRYIKNTNNFSRGSVDNIEYSKFLLQKDDVIITKDSETPDDIAVPSVVVESINDLICGYHLAILRPIPNKIDGIFLMNLLQLKKINKQFANKANGFTRFGLTIDTISKAVIPTPSLPEQRTITSVLTTIDEAIEATEKIIAKRRRVKEGLMQDLFRYGLDEKGNLRSEATHAFKDSALGRIPAEWDAVEFVEYGENKKHAIVDGPFGSNLKTEHYREDGIPVIQSGYVTEGIFFAINYVYVDLKKFKEQIRSKAVGGDLIIAKIGAYCGMCALLPYNHQDSIIAGNCLKASIDQKYNNFFLLNYLHYRYKRTKLEEIKATTAQPSINLTKIKAMKVIMPKPEEQKQIADVLFTTDRSEPLKL